MASRTLHTRTRICRSTTRSAGRTPSRGSRPRWSGSSSYSGIGMGITLLWPFLPVSVFFFFFRGECLLSLTELPTGGFFTLITYSPPRSERKRERQHPDILDFPPVWQWLGIVPTLGCLQNITFFRPTCTVQYIQHIQATATYHLPYLHIPTLAANLLPPYLLLTYLPLTVLFFLYPKHLPNLTQPI